MKDIEDKLAAFLMEYGVLKNADADKMAKKIAEMFETEIQDAKASERAAQKGARINAVVNSELAGKLSTITVERDQLAAKVAEMRSILERCAAMAPTQSELINTLSDSCGEGWLSPEKAQTLRDALRDITLIEWNEENSMDYWRQAHDIAILALSETT